MVFQWYLLGYFPNGLQSLCYFLLTDPGMSCHCRMQFSATWNYQQALQAVNEVRLTCPNRAFLKSQLGGKSGLWLCSPSASYQVPCAWASPCIMSGVPGPASVGEVFIKQKPAQATKGGIKSSDHRNRQATRRNYHGSLFACWKPRCRQLPFQI